MSPKRPVPSIREQNAAIDDLRKLYEETLNLLIGPNDPPLWKRVQLALACYARLPLDPIPPVWRRRIDLTFRRVNGVLAKYPIKTFDDYRLISDEDLVLLKDIILDIPVATKSQRYRPSGSPSTG